MIIKAFELITFFIFFIAFQFFMVFVIDSIMELYVRVFEKIRTSCIEIIKFGEKKSRVRAPGDTTYNHKNRWRARREIDKTKT